MIFGVPVGSGNVFDVPFALEFEDLAVDTTEVLVIWE